MAKRLTKKGQEEYAAAIILYIHEHGCPKTTLDMVAVMEQTEQAILNQPQSCGYWSGFESAPKGLKTGKVVSFMKAKYAVLEVNGDKVKLKQLGFQNIVTVPISELD